MIRKTKTKKTEDKVMSAPAVVLPPAPTLDPQRPSVLLRTAVDLIKNVGWTQGTYRRYSYADGHEKVVSYCAIGALDEALNKTGGYKEDRFVAAREFLSQAVKGQTTRVGVVSWNDETGRTKEQVLAAFEKAVAAAEAVGR